MNFLKSSSVGLVLVGVFIGFVLFAGTKYTLDRTNDRAFCASCHIMSTAAVTHKMSTHANLACNDCHTPHNNTVSYLWTKAKYAVHDVTVNMTGSASLPIMTSDSMKTIINDNCIRCHTMTNIDVASMAVKDSCTSCHRNVPHMSKKPIDTRMVSYD